MFFLAVVPRASGFAPLLLGAMEGVGSWQVLLAVVPRTSVPALCAAAPLWKPSSFNAPLAALMVASMPQMVHMFIHTPIADRLPARARCVGPLAACSVITLANQSKHLLGRPLG